MADTTNFAKLIPGFDFLQDLMKGAGSQLPGVSQWIAPTLDPQELDKRIRDLRTVQFWLEQNAKMLGATIQALEVQRMTLATLTTMNVPMDALRESMTLRTPAAPAPAPERKPEPAPEPAPAPAAATPAPAAAPAATPAVDPLQWWNALTQQFGELAANALKEMPAAAAAAGAPAPQAAGAAKPKAGAKAATKTATKAAAKATRTARKAPAKRRRTT